MCINKIYIGRKRTTLPDDEIWNAIIYSIHRHWIVKYFPVDHILTLFPIFTNIININDFSHTLNIKKTEYMLYILFTGFPYLCTQLVATTRSTFPHLMFDQFQCHWVFVVQKYIYILHINGEKIATVFNFIAIWFMFWQHLMINKSFLFCFWFVGLCIK